jgi:hypothetical protein
VGPVTVRFSTQDTAIAIFTHEWTASSSRMGRGIPGVTTGCHSFW